MDTIAFRATGHEGLTTVINGRDLRDVLAVRGWYGFYPQLALPPSDALLGGEPQSVNSYEPEWFSTGLPVLVCGCGEAGCGSVLVDVHVERGEVVWQHFRELRAEEDPKFEGVGPFRFAMGQYRAAVRALVEELRLRGPREVG